MITRALAYPRYTRASALSLSLSLSHARTHARAHTHTHTVGSTTISIKRRKIDRTKWRVRMEAICTPFEFRIDFLFSFYERFHEHKLYPPSCLSYNETLNSVGTNALRTHMQSADKEYTVLHSRSQNVVSMQNTKQDFFVKTKISHHHHCYYYYYSNKYWIHVDQPLTIRAQYSWL